MAQSERRWIAGDFRLTISREGLRIEALDYHAETLYLTETDLADLGLFLGEDVTRRVSRSRRWKGYSSQRKRRVDL